MKNLLKYLPQGEKCVGSKTPLLRDFVASREFSISLLDQFVKTLCNIKHNNIISSTLELTANLEVGLKTSVFHFNSNHTIVDIFCE